MLAGGMAVAVPAMVPTAAAAGQLYVSAENAQFGNLFGGAQIVEVIVRDPNRADTEVAEAEPTVYVDNQRLRMAQGVDGYWYAYIGSYTEVLAADSAANGLDFGLNLALGQDHISVSGSGESDMSTYANLATGTISPFLGATGGVITNPPALSNYNGTNNVHAGYANATNTDQSSVYGQIGVNATEWPFIQTFDFTQGDFDIILEQAGTDEIVTLDYNSADLDDYSSLTLDRNSGPQGAQVHVTITDNQLNIDPTNEDVVVFNLVDATGAVGTVTFSNGTRMPAANTQMAFDNTFGDNGVLLVDYDATGVGTNVLVNEATLDDTLLNYYVVFVEDADNSGIFTNTDDNDDSNLDVLSTAKRGTTATFTYNDDSQSYIVSNDFGTIDMDESSIGVEWNSGETLAVTLVDQDLNKNTLSDEDLTVQADNTLIPSLQIGSPVSLSETSTYETVDMDCGTFNKLCMMDSTPADLKATTVQMTYPGTTVGDFRALTEGASFVFVNFDVSTVVDTSTAVTLVDSLANGDDTAIATLTTPLEKGLIQLGAITASPSAAYELRTLAINFTTGEAPIGGSTSVIYADVFTFGDKVNNAIYRLLLEETGDNTATFVGEVEFIMLNQINHDLSTTYSTLTTVSDDINIIVHEDLTDEDSPRINYLDLGADGVNTQIADQVAAPSHSGVVTFDSDNYKTADTVVITLDDQDMNTDSDLIDVYITSGNDHVGENASNSNSYVLDVTFNDVLWQAAASGYTDGSPHDGLSASGFTLVETGIDSGLFVGSFQVPSTYYDSGLLTTPSTTGTDIEVNYNDHRDASGETIEVGAGASINANTGSVSFDRTVYPVPFGNETSVSYFALHSSAANLNGLTVENNLAQGNVTVHVRITDADYDVSAFG